MQAQSRKRAVQDKGRSGAPWVGLGRALTADDVSAPPELRAALLQVSQGVEHLHSLRIVHRFVWRAMAYLPSRGRGGQVGGRGGSFCTGVEIADEQDLPPFVFLERLTTTHTIILYVLLRSRLNGTEPNPPRFSLGLAYRIPQVLHTSLIFGSSSSNSIQHVRCTFI